MKKSINRLRKSVKAVSPKKAVQAAKSAVKKRSSTKHLSVYANLANKRKLKKDKQSRERAEYLASLPKHPVKRFFYRLHPKRVAKYWFSKRGAMMLLKITGVTIAVVALLVIGAFAYFRKDLDKIRPGEIAKRVQTTVTKYYDRNGVLLWEDKGTGNYKLVVESDQISQYLKHATVAIEDKDFYKHHGVSISGLTRAMLSNARGGQVQGGSTLTQQLVKQVFFAEEAGERGLKGIPRKIKEMILAIEVERMYNKDQILTLYLNESPYGGRRNGAESASQTYFRKSAKDLTLAEAALLAGIPQNPSHFNPYNPAGHKALIARQHTVLDYMAEQGYVTQKEADEAKKYPILDNIHPQIEQTEGIKAPHFVLMVRSQLEKELGKGVVGRGGLTVKTTLDWRIQEKLEQEMKAFFDSGRPKYAGASNGSSVIEDAQTGQIVALLGSRDFSYPVFGQDNAANAFIQPGSSIKPFVVAHLFENHPGQPGYGSGTVLADENIDRIYGAKLNNWDNRFMGNIPLRRSLGLSRNTPIVKAMYIAGNGSAVPTVEYIRKVGNTEYCMPEQNAGGYGLSAAIGGCGSQQIGLTNAYGTLARLGTHKQSSTVMEVTNSQGETLKKWKDNGEQSMDPQVAYIMNDILADRGNTLVPAGIPGVRAGFKTGTSDRGNQPKDIWLASYTPALAMTVWLGNSDGATLGTINSTIALPVIQKVMAYGHTEIYAKEGKWNPNMWYNRPAGIQQVGRELYPSWWNKSQSQSTTKMTFDRVSKKKATQCTPDAAREEVEVTKVTDPITKKEVITAPDGYDAKADDDVHNCDDTKPRIGGISVKRSGGSHVIEVSAISGKFSLATIDISVDGRSVKSGALSAAGGTERVSVNAGSGQHTVTVTIRDEAYYTATGSTTFRGSVSSGN
ncbi:MAG: transglycosylase domain-containing protein [Candidatus Saccharibacteria bacterium]|nr:transglycosylase domain-containing protein [Candidatus Saccharibacteria bacterium]